MRIRKRKRKKGRGRKKKKREKKREERKGSWTIRKDLILEDEWVVTPLRLDLRPRFAQYFCG